MALGNSLTQGIQIALQLGQFNANQRHQAFQEDLAVAQDTRQQKVFALNKANVARTNMEARLGGLSLEAAAGRPQELLNPGNQDIVDAAAKNKFGEVPGASYKPVFEKGKLTGIQQFDTNGKPLEFKPLGLSEFFTGAAGTFGLSGAKASQRFSNIDLARNAAAGLQPPPDPNAPPPTPPAAPIPEAAPLVGLDTAAASSPNTYSGQSDVQGFPIGSAGNDPADILANPPFVGPPQFSPSMAASMRGAVDKALASGLSATEQVNAIARIAQPRGGLPDSKRGSPQEAADYVRNLVSTIPPPQGAARKAVLAPSMQGAIDKALKQGSDAEKKAAIKRIASVGGGLPAGTKDSLPAMVKAARALFGG